MPDFLNAFSKETEIYRTDFGGFDTLYLGGGTPSAVSVKDMETIMKAVSGKFALSPHAEITIEVNPADIGTPYLKALRSMGINRINVGIQSFDDDVLTFLGRRHKRRQAISAFKAAEKAGFDNIGMDLIYGVPGQESKSWMDTLNMALSLNPAHLSCYQLTVEQGTPLSIRQAKGEFAMPGEETLADLFFTTAEIVEKAGYIHYEVSNFARNADLQSRHNQKYWDHAPYLGLGPAAHSFDGRRRWWNHRSLSEYVKDLERGNPPVEASESLNHEQLRMEAFFLGLRTKNGICLQDYKLRYGYDLLAEKGERLSMLKERKLVEIKNGFLKPTLAGLAVADSLALL